MDATETYPSSWLKAEDIKKDVKVTINEAKLIDVKENKKIQISFTELDAALLLNKTNAMKLIEAFGKDTDNWIDKVIELYTALTTFQGKEMPAIRLRAVKSGE